MIYTTYFANLKKLPTSIVPISIAGKAPDGYRGPQFKNLAPKIEFFLKWKQDHDNDAYIESYKRLILDKLDPKEVEDYLYFLSDAMDIALVCYEKPGNFCHRHLVSQWLRDADIPVKEWEENDHVLAVQKENCGEKQAANLQS